MSSRSVRYVGHERANIDYHDGQLRPVVGVQSYQVLRANRTHPEEADAYGWTYNHAPMLAYWRERFHLEYLSNPIGEHMPPGQTLLTTSADGRVWDKPRVIFPPYVIPDAVYPKDLPYQLTPGTYSVMHQRMGFYVAPNDRLLALAFYGIAPHPRMSPQDGRGIGRVVREIYADGNWGPICFIRYNRHAGWNESNTAYPHYITSTDVGFVEACDALLANRLVTMQWWEEDRAKDGFYSVAGYQAPSVYHASDGRAVAMWKWSHTAVSDDEGSTWSVVRREPSLVMAGAKIWGQRTADGRYALVYNPSTHGYHRWPLAIITGDDGYSFDDLMCVAGEVPPRRFYGNSKDYGPQYVRGIIEGNGEPPGGDMWLTYSMNKEDIWVSRVPVPVRGRVIEPVADTFDDMVPGGEIVDWNIYSPLWAPVTVVQSPTGMGNCLELRDQDPFDYAKAERVFPEGRLVSLHTRVMTRQSGTGELHIEVAGARGQTPVRIWFAADSRLWAMDGCIRQDLGEYSADQWYDLDLTVDALQQAFELRIDQMKVSRTLSFDASVDSVQRVVFRTGPIRREPFPETPRDPGTDVLGADDPIDLAVYLVDSLSATWHQADL